MKSNTFLNQKPFGNKGSLFYESQLALGKPFLSMHLIHLPQLPKEMKESIKNHIYLC